MSNEFPAHLAHQMIFSEKKTIDNFKASGVEINTLSPSEKKKLQSLGEEVAAHWIEEMKGKGLPGKEALHFLMGAESRIQGEVETKGYPWARK